MRNQHREWQVEIPTFLWNQKGNHKFVCETPRSMSSCFPLIFSSKVIKLHDKYLSMFGRCTSCSRDIYHGWNTSKSVRAYK